VGRPLHRGGLPEPRRLYPRPATQDALSDVGQEGEHEVELLLNRRLVRGVLRYLVRWRGHNSANDKLLRAEELAAPRRRAARRADPTAEPAAAPPAASPPAPTPLVPPAGFRLTSSSEGRAGAGLVGQVVLYRWPVEGWVRGTVAGRSRAAGFSHVVRYGRASALGLAVVPSLLDAASHGPTGRWVLLRRVPR
jgi:hypothetical protein